MTLSSLYFLFIKVNVTFTSSNHNCSTIKLTLCALHTQRTEMHFSARCERGL